MQKKPNPWGLFDMHGNVAEWCSDNYSTATNQEDHGFRIVRGGGYSSTSEFANSRTRGIALATDRLSNIGFRLAADGDVDVPELRRVSDPLHVQGFDRLIQKAKALDLERRSNGTATQLEEIRRHLAKEPAER